MIRLFIICLVAILSVGCSDSVLYKVEESKPDIVVYPTEIDFGNLHAGYESNFEEIVIVNTGTGDLHLSPAELFDG